MCISNEKEMSRIDQMELVQCGYEIAAKLIPIGILCQNIFKSNKMQLDTISDQWDFYMKTLKGRSILNVFGL